LCRWFDSDPGHHFFARMRAFKWNPSFVRVSGSRMNVQPDLQSSLLCDDVRQERNGKFILIGLFDAVASPTFPLRYPRLCMVNRWCSGQGHFTQTTKVLKPDRETVLLQGKSIPVRLNDEFATATNVELFLNVEFTEPGTYWIEIYLEDRLRLSYPLRVAQVQQNQPPPQMG